MNTSLFILITAILAIVIPFEIWGFMNESERAKLLRWSYIHLPHQITRTKRFQALRWKYFYSEARMMFWGRCFVTRHDWVYIGVGIQCKDCKAFTPNYLLDGVMNFETVEDVFKTVV